MVYPANITLSANGLDDLVLDPRHGWAVQSLDMGDPIVRAVAQSAPGRHGTIDTTELVGERAVTLHVIVTPDVYADLAHMEAHLRAFTHPRLRPTMTVERPGAVTQQITLRRGTCLAPLADHRYIDMIAQWVAPSGVWESATLNTVEVSASAVEEIGFEFDMEFDLDFGSAPPVGEIVATNAGTIDAAPLIQLHGPWSGETRIVNVTAGRQLVIDNESVSAGTYLELDVARRTVTLNGDPANGRYDRIVTPGWWELLPGPNVLRFLPDTFSSPARMVVAWRDAWI